MNIASTLFRRISGAGCLVILGLALLVPSPSQASKGATDPIPGTSKGTTNSGGGGGGGGGGGKSGTVVTLPPIPTTPVQPVVSGPLAMVGRSYNGATVQCTGSYHVDPYYPTLSLMTIDLSLSSVSNYEGLPLAVVLVGAGGSTYPYLGLTFIVSGGNGTAHSQIYVTPGTTISSVSVLDMYGTVLASGN